MKTASVNGMVNTTLCEKFVNLESTQNGDEPTNGAR